MGTMMGKAGDVKRPADCSEPEAPLFSEVQPAHV